MDDVPGMFGHRHVPGAPPGAADLADACTRMPRAVACLLSAAHLEGLLDEPPPGMWLALPRGANATKACGKARRVLHWSHPGALEVGVVEDEVGGFRIRRTAAARTVVDLVRYSRHLGGIAPGVRAASRYVAQGGRPVDFLVVAEVVEAPSATMRSLEVLAATLQAGSP